MTHMAGAALLRTISDDIQLFAFAVLDDLACHGSALHDGSAHLDAAFFAHGQNFVEADSVARGNFHLLYEDDVAFLHPILLTTGNDNCVHSVSSFNQSRWYKRRVNLSHLFAAQTKRL